MWKLARHVGCSTFDMVRGGALFILLTGLIVACSASEKSEKLCTPDANVFCRCTDRKEGTKKCKADGKSFEACLPCDGSGDPGPGASTASRNPLGAGDDESDRATKPSADTATKTPKADPIAEAEEPKKETSATPSKTPPKTSSSSSSSSSSSGSSAARVPDAPHCKPLKNIAPKVETQQVADSATTAIGGKPVDGVYVQSWVVELTGEGGAVGGTKKYSSQTLELMGEVGRFVAEDGGKTTTGGFRLTTKSGTKLNVAYECPAAPDHDYAFDATDSTLILYDPPIARVFVRQKEGT